MQEPGQDQVEEIDIEQMLADVRRDRKRFRGPSLPPTDAVWSELDRTILSYVEDILKVLIMHDESLGEIEEAVDSGYSSSSPLTQQLIEHVVELAGVADGLATERMQLAAFIHGCSTLQEVKSKVGKPDDLEPTMRHVVELSKVVLSEIAEMSGAEEGGDSPGGDSPDASEAATAGEA